MPFGVIVSWGTVDLDSLWGGVGAFSQNSNSTENSTLQNFYVSTLGVLQSMALVKVLKKYKE